MKKRLLVCVLFVLLAASLACGTTIPSAPTETVDPNRLGTMVAATVEALESTPETAPQPTTTPDAETAPQPTTVPDAEASPTQAPAGPPCLPAHPGAQVLPLPAGFAANINTLAVTFFDTYGNPLGNKQTPGLTWLEPAQVHIGGGLSQGIPTLPLVYHSLENGGVLKSSTDGGVVLVAQTPSLVALTGGAGNAFIAFSTNDIDQAADGWVNYLYAGELGIINGAQPLVTRSEGDGFVIYPLAMRTGGGVAQGVWYTLSMWGIGNIHFAPYNGLYYLNLANNQVTEFLGFDARLAGFSPDQSMVAFGPNLGGQPGGLTNGFTVKNLLTCQETFIPFNPNTNLGGGYVVFSPDNEYLAWLEASGPNNMEVQMRLRIAQANGTVLVDSENAGLSGLMGGETPSYIRPVGWLANHLLLLEIGIPALESPTLVVWAPDPSQPLSPALGANQSAPLADGVFAGFLYP